MGANSLRPYEFPNQSGHTFKACIDSAVICQLCGRHWANSLHVEPSTDFAAQPYIIVDTVTTFASGAKRSEKKPNYAYNPGYAERLIAQRFEVGHKKYDPDEVYEHANWLRAIKARDVAFVRQLFSHLRDHLKAEERGHADPDAGGNIGAMGWALEIMAYVQATDPALYRAAQGLEELPSATPLRDAVLRAAEQQEEAINDPWHVTG